MEKVRTLLLYLFRMKFESSTRQNFGIVGKIRIRITGFSAVQHRKDNHLRKMNIRVLVT